MQGCKPHPIHPVKELLSGYHALIRRRDMIAEEIEEHYTRATSCTSRIKPIYSVSGGASDKVGDNTLKALEAKEAYQEAQKRLNEKVSQMLTAIELADTEQQRAILTARYIRRKPWKEIASDLDLTENWVYHLHGRALEVIRRKMEL